MVAPGKPLHFGKHTLILLMFRKTTVGFVLFVVSGAIAFIAPSIAAGIAKLVVSSGSMASATVHISSTLAYFNMILFLGSIIIGMIGMVIALLEYRSLTFELDELSFNIRQGIVHQVEMSLPYRQIENIHLIRSPIHQLFGTARLVLVKPGHEDDPEDPGADKVLDPIDADIAQEIRSFLEYKIGVQFIRSAIPQNLQAQGPQIQAQPPVVSPPQNHA